MIKINGPNDIDSDLGWNEQWWILRGRTVIATAINQRIAKRIATILNASNIKEMSKRCRG